jgi:hypothetical protein
LICHSQSGAQTPTSSASPLLRDLSFGIAAAKYAAAEAKSADALHSKGYAFRKKGNFVAAIEE